MTRATRIKKGDVVFVLTGKEKGKTGKVLDIDHEKERAFVEKLMVVKRHFKRGRNPAAPAQSPPPHRRKTPPRKRLRRPKRNPSRTPAQRP